MRGRKVDDPSHEVDLWFRTTVVLKKVSARWQIVHEHDSVPFYMDGSLRAAVDLQPDAARGQRAPGSQLRLAHKTYRRPALWP